MGNVVWRGSKQLTQAPTSPEFTDGKDGPTWTYSYEGQWSVVTGAIPLRGTRVAGMEPLFAIDTVRVQKQPGGRGTMSFTVCKLPLPSVDEENKDTLEVEWVQIEKKLETHPLYKSGAGALTDEDLVDIDFWKDEKDPANRKAFKYLPETGAVVTLSANAIAFCKKLLRGQDSYADYAPICRATTTTTKAPLNTKCGITDSPPRDVTIAGYQYLKTADRATRRDRKWERVREWTGANSIDSDIYKSS